MKATATAEDKVVSSSLEVLTFRIKEYTAAFAYSLTGAKELNVKELFPLLTQANLNVDIVELGDAFLFATYINDWVLRFDPAQVNPKVNGVHRVAIKATDVMGIKYNFKIDVAVKVTYEDVLAYKKSFLKVGLSDFAETIELVDGKGFGLGAEIGEVDRLGQF